MKVLKIISTVGRRSMVGRGRFMMVYWYNSWCGNNSAVRQFCL